MMLSLALLVTLAAPIQRADTTIIVPAASRLEVKPLGGEIVVRTWERNEVRIEADYTGRRQVRVKQEGSVIKVDTESNSFGPAVVDYRITLPARMDLDLGGVNVDIDVSGTQGRVEATTVNGGIRVVGGSRLVLQAVNGSVRAEGVRGAIDAKTVNGSLRLTDIQGPVAAQTVSGGLILEQISSGDVQASSVSGRIFYDGGISNDGRYSFATHSGSIVLALPRNVNATVEVALVNGSISSSFPGLTLQGRSRDRRQSFTLGSGMAVVEAESFSGSIRIAERGTVTP